MAKILETNLCRINYSDSLEELSNATVKLLQNKIVEYKKLFNKCNIYNNWMHYYGYRYIFLFITQ